MSRNAFQEGEQARFYFMAFHFGGGYFVLFVQWQNTPITAFCKTDCQVGALEIPSERIYPDIAKDKLIVKPISHPNKNPWVSRFLIRSALEGTLMMPKWENFYYKPVGGGGGGVRGPVQ